MFGSTFKKMSKLRFRFSENQKMKVRRPPKNHQKSMKKRLRKHVGKKSPTFVQNGSTWGPTWVPRGEGILGFSPLGAQYVSFSCFCCFLSFLVAFLGHLGTILGATWGHFGIILGPFWNHFVPYLDQCLLQRLCLVCLHFFDFFNCFFPGPGGLRAAL